ncbi:DUF6751 family protein [Ethanoligenens harbinense]|uniref:Uncharacterized protein n=1 Tax=Ethanoligenens harbinense (strain DSM 18485 / JCM 12961 / CGMCC 1.5033 / YUAN-3) TaxID=663278 RepID=E6U607_ETHHY|nr:DUF6751 family protein [Ethanoligenens harbinense]ADU25686.1 hypothetical protein Ethha_0096 [Ethanoligenens harbinense YUAN-3]AVQ94861.1 hypothetical protein CXQ68_00490 [Ethanoligenens harbinense YUAN-3]AYF37552.1 hypothetical protein CXP51_00495 [Ethanoligenens harbinense]AYF40272.1 hypothetical protein CN246_00490 [Ethanoligenens harbinense]QCN91107.1 hypothetical protein DRA42_00500 [Ethanoligenens harbinense]
MTTNADITLYNQWYNRVTRLIEWKRVQIPGVSWHGGIVTDVTGNGLQAANAYIVRIPLDAAPAGRTFACPEDWAATESDDLGALWTIQPGDILINGLLADDIAKASDLTAKYGSRCCTVIGWKDNRRGSAALQHWRIDGK